MTNYEMAKLVKAVRHSAYMWSKKNAKVEEPRTIDKQKRVEKCLHCPYMECIDCFNNPQGVAEEIFILTEIGMKAKEIYSALGISRSNFYKLKSQYKGGLE